MTLGARPWRLGGFCPSAEREGRFDVLAADGRAGNVRRAASGYPARCAPGCQAPGEGLGLTDAGALAEPVGLGLAEAGALAEPVGLGLAEAGALAEPVGLGLAEACALAGPVGLGEGSGIWVTAWLGGAGGAELAGSAGR